MKIFIGIVIALSLAVNSHAKTELTETPHKRLDYLALSETLSTEADAKLYIEPANVSFDEKWLRRYKHELDKSSQRRTRDAYGKMITKRIGSALGERFVLTDDPQDADYLAKVELTELRVNGPDNDLRKKHFVRRAGSATLHVTVSDAKSLTPVLVIKDKRKTRENIIPSLRPATKVFNRHDFNILFKRWANTVSELIAQI